jgi:hypothetical protein
MTGPSHITVLSVPTGSTHLNLDEPRFADLLRASQGGIPLKVVAENANVYMAWHPQGSGAAADPTATAFVGTGMNQCQVVFSGVTPYLPEMIPPGYKGLTITAAGANAILRLSRIG